jgi:hypothetical protein
MRRIRVVLLSGFAVAALGGVTTSAAAAVKFEWSVGGTPLAAGQRLTIQVAMDPSDPTISFKSKVGGGSVELTTSHITARAVIYGGKPGTGEGVVTAEKVTVVKPKNCKIAGGEVKTEPVEAAIVEGATGELRGVPMVMFRPETGSGFDQIEFESEGGTCTLSGDTVEQTGIALARTASTKEAKVALGSVEPFGTEVLSSTGTLITTGVTNGMEPVEVSGNLEVSLANEDSWSVL